VRGRRRAWLLLALFLGAGTSLPSADALLHHLHAHPMAGRVHVEPLGGCTAHADHCTLGRTPPGSRALAPLPLLPRVVHDEVARRPVQSGARLASAPRPFLPPSRAPPVTPA
jgi:hypothetical protein